MVRNPAVPRPGEGGHSHVPVASVPPVRVSGALPSDFPSSAPLVSAVSCYCCLVWAVVVCFMSPVLITKHCECVQGVLHSFMTRQVLQYTE